MLIHAPNNTASLKVRFVIFLALILIAPISVCTASGNPKRIASINLCTDQLLLMLAPAERIVSVSALSLDPHSSYMANVAKNHHSNHGKTEEILPLKPDLILASGYAARPAVALLRKLGYRVEVLPMATNLAGIRSNISTIASLLGEESKGRQLITQMDKKISQIQKQWTENKEKAIFYQPRGYTSGKNTLQDEALRLAGWDNVAADAGVEGYNSIGLEELLIAKPAQIFTSSYAPGTSSMAQRQLQHPILKHLTSDRPMIEIDYRFWICDGPMIADAIEALAAAHK